MTISSDEMQEATRLTRAGRLGEATALLRRVLGGAPSAAPAPAPRRRAARPPVIDHDPAPEPQPEQPSTTRRWLNLMRGKSAPPEAVRAMAPGAVPAGARFIEGVFSNGADSRGYKLYIPGTRRDTAAPLIVMLHGCTQSPDDFAAGTQMNALAEAHGCFIVYPGQTSSANAQKCWNWFSPFDQRRGQGEPALIAGITQQVIAEHAIDPQRVYVAGLSAGGAAAAIMGLAYPDIYAAVGVHSGLACGAARDVPSAFAAMRGGSAGPAAPAAGQRQVPTIVFHADRDTTVHPRNGDQVIAQATAPGGLTSETSTGRVPGGHAYSRTIHADASGAPVLEQWVIHGGGHAWSGGSPAGSYTDPKGPDASAEMLRFFLAHRRRD